MIELIIRKIFDIGLITILISFLTPLFQQLHRYFIEKLGKTVGICVYILLFGGVIFLFSNQTLNIYIAKKFIEQDSIISTDIDFAIKILSSPTLLDNQDAQMLLYKLLKNKDTSSHYKEGTILWRLIKKGNAEAAIELGKKIDEGKIDLKELKNRSEAIFYCFELGRCLGFNLGSEPAVHSRWKLLESIISSEISQKAKKTCRDIKNEL